MDIGELLKKFSNSEPKSNSFETIGMMLWEYSNDSKNISYYSYIIYTIEIFCITIY